MKKRLFGILCAGILVLGLWGCGRETGVTFEGHPSSPYLTALARGEYYLEMSMLSDGVIVSNSLAMKDGAIESRSQVGDSVSHTLRLKDTTYFLDDENRVYFVASAFGDDGLRGSIDYAAAEYIGSGRDTLLTGSEYVYDEYTCRTYDNYACTLRLYTDEEGDPCNFDIFAFDHHISCMFHHNKNNIVSNISLFLYILYNSPIFFLLYHTPFPYKGLAIVFLFFVATLLLFENRAMVSPGLV